MRPGKRRKTRNWVFRLAKVAAAAIIDPTGASAAIAATQELIGTVSELLNTEESSTLDRLINRAAAGLEKMAKSERISSAQADRAVSTAEKLFNNYGISISDLISSELDPYQAAERLLRRGADIVRVLAETEKSLCRRFICAVYSESLKHPQQWRELAFAFQKRVLERLARLEQLPEKTAQLIRALAVPALLVDPSRTWLANRSPPSALLRAEYGIVPFHSRENELNDIRRWCENANLVSKRAFPC